MGLDLNYNNRQTPINEDERQGLLIPTITTCEELNEYEQLNIEKAVEYYLFRRKFRANTILTEKFLLDVHKKMLSDVWGWAGEIRKSNKNIGVDKFQIPLRLRQLLGNCKFWIENNLYSDKEIAIRFKHELVAIHVFSNGNGRHSRLMGDIIMKHIFGKPIFTWGHKNLVHEGDVRDSYIKALRKADNGDIEDLMAFSTQ